MQLQFLTISLSWQIKTSIWVIERITNVKQLKYLLIGGMFSLEQKIGRFKFLVLQVYQLKMVADAKRRRSSFIMYVKVSLSVDSFMF